MERDQSLIPDSTRHYASIQDHEAGGIVQEKNSLNSYIDNLSTIGQYSTTSMSIILKNLMGGGSRPLLDNVQKKYAFFSDVFPKWSNCIFTIKLVAR